jgi:conjugal transfer/entry exclusion protein
MAKKKANKPPKKKKYTMDDAIKSLAYGLDAIDNRLKVIENLFDQYVNYNNNTEDFTKYLKEKFKEMKDNDSQKNAKSDEQDSKGDNKD